MNLIRIDKNNQVNGEGLRCVIWVAGCENYCHGCHNPETWDYNVGNGFTASDYLLIEQQLQSPEISGITLTGGDPFAPKNRAVTKQFCIELKQQHPDKTIWAYTGHLYEEIKDYLTAVDVLVDGKYIEDLNSGVGKIKWRGSSNQRVIDVQKSLKSNMVCNITDFKGSEIL